MSVQRWSARHPPDQLGVVVHGPAILAGSADAGVVAGLRCVFAHPSGLHLPVIVTASGIYAEAAGRWSRRRRGQAQAGERAESGGVGAAPLRSLVLTVEVNGHRGPADLYQARSRSSEEHYELDADHWIPELPSDGQVRVTTGWPEIGLHEHTTLLSCETLSTWPSGSTHCGRRPRISRVWRARHPPPCRSRCWIWSGCRCARHSRPGMRPGWS